jgi:hypothetical protein
LLELSNSFSSSDDFLIIKLNSSGNIPNCNIIQDVSPTVTNVSPTVTVVSPTVTNVSPTVTVVSPTVTVVSPDESNICYAPSSILDISDGKTYLNISTSTSNAFLNIGGSIQIGQGGTPINKIQHGIIGNCSVAGSAGSSGTVQFPYQFNKVPIILIQPSEEVDNNGCTSVRIISRSTTGFSWNAWSGGTSTSCDCIYWMAIEP